MGRETLKRVPSATKSGGVGGAKGETGRRTDERESVWREVMLPTLPWMLPENELPPRSKEVRDFKAPRLFGRLPEKEAGCAARSWSAERAPTDEASVPPIDVLERSIANS